MRPCPLPDQQCDPKNFKCTNIVKLLSIDQGEENTFVERRLSSSLSLKSTYPTKYPGDICTASEQCLGGATCKVVDPKNPGIMICVSSGTLGSECKSHIDCDVKYYCQKREIGQGGTC